MSNKIEWLGTLRGIAVLLVFISHLYIISDSYFGFTIGKMGVGIFFLIGGYLAKKSREKRTSKQYIINRLLRIYPMYWIILIVYSLVSFYIKKNSTITLKAIILNMTTFNEFFGIDCIIGSSWMLPILIMFYIVIGLLGIDFFCKSRNLKINNCIKIMIFYSSLAVTSGLLRKITGLQFPTAFFLFPSLGFVGLFSNFKKDKCIIIIFEITLIAASVLSYNNEAIFYILAYNGGLILFLLFKKTNICYGILDKIGDLGFTFFLGAIIPRVILDNFIDFKSNIILIILGSILNFFLTFILAEISTKYIEKPLLRFFKGYENKF